MPLIGSRALAAAIASYNPYDCDFSVPEGFRAIGEGCFRSAYLHEATGVVYKVEHYSGEASYGNKREAKVASILRKHNLVGVRIPKTSLFKIDGTAVIAMEMVEGTLFSKVYDSTSDKYVDALIELYNLNLQDMHGYNFILDNDGYLVPIDMASRFDKQGGDCRTLSSHRSSPKVAPLLAKRGWL